MQSFCDRMTTAWNIAKVQTRVREQQHPAPSASVKRPIDDVAKQPLLLVARPKARLFPLAAIRTRKFTQAVVQSSVSIAAPKADRRSACLLAMFQMAVLRGSSNMVFVADLIGG